ncbi:glycosyltransferase [Patulibacter defluvii]|uniref:glycosyltransferase n=1 Tax=Patulibacter defluvii TaxID=3095358 RepID=UPI002A752180|nr:glycosyltransferase [Patulibacter sp. DM4]
MPPAAGHRALYASFDRFPSRKGSAVHIDRFARTLFDHHGGGLLYVLGGDGLPPYQREGPVEVVRFERPEPRFLARALAFGARLDVLLDDHAKTLELCHFRDPWSGLPIVERFADRPPGARPALVYEVNGLPSIELPFLFPRIPRATLDRVAELERRCLDAADAVVTPAHAIAAALAARGVGRERLHVIPNGADLPPATARPAAAPPRYLLYFGAVQPWQGLDTALRALARLEDLDDLGLVVCSSVHRRRTKPYVKLAERLGVADRVQWHVALPEAELAPWREHAALSLAPLRDCERNVVQGCSPLKLLESMASGTAVVASDLPAVRELVDDGVEGRLVHPDRPAELARAIRVLLDHPERVAEMGRAGRRRVAAGLTWTHATDALRDCYSTLAARRDRMRPVPAIGLDDAPAVRP